MHGQHRFERCDLENAQDAGIGGDDGNAGMAFRDAVVEHVDREVRVVPHWRRVSAMMSGRGVQDAGTPMIDTILLTFPSKSAFRGVPSLVLSGLGSRLDLPFERMDDLQLAVLSMLDASSGNDASVEIEARDDRVAVSVGPLRAEADADEGLDLVLRRLTDGVEAGRRGGDVWLTVFVAREDPQRA